MMIVRTAYPQRVGPSVEPGTVIAGKYLLLRCDASDTPPSWLARKIADDTLCTLHLMEPVEGEAARAAFEREMEAVSKLMHPQLVPILDFGWDDTGLLFTAEQRLEPEAQSLAEALEDAPLTQIGTVELIAQLLKVLDLVHSAGLTHGDLQLKQLWIRRVGEHDELLLRGLGRARFQPFHFHPPEEDAQGRISAEWIVGSPEYASPEQLVGGEHDARSDLYAVGLLMFRLLTGCSPFASTRALELAWMHRFSLPRPPSTYVGLSAALETVCLKALSKTPELRYQSAAEMLEALRAAHPAAPVPARVSRFSLPALRMSSATLLLPASTAAVQGVEPRTSLAPKREPRPARDWTVPLALGILTFTLTSIGMIASPKLGWWAPERSAGTEAETEVSLAQSLEPLGSGPGVGAFWAPSEGESTPRPEDPAGPDALGTPNGEPHQADLVSVQGAGIAKPGDTHLAGTLAGVAALGEREDVERAADGSADPRPATQEAERVNASTTHPGAPLPEGDRPLANAASAGGSGPNAGDDGAAAAAKPANASETEAARAPRPSSVPKRANVQSTPSQRPNPTPAAPQRTAAAAGAAPMDGQGQRPDAQRAQVTSKPGRVAEVPEAPAAYRTYHPSSATTARPEVLRQWKSIPMPPPVTLSAGTIVTPVPAVPADPPREYTGPSASAHGGPEVRVLVGRTRVRGGAASSGSVHAALNIESIERCYRVTREGSGAKDSLKAELEVETELSGRIASAKLRGNEVPPQLADCVSELRYGRIRGADTGSLHATIELVFQRR